MIEILILWTIFVFFDFLYTINAYKVSKKLGANFNNIEVNPIMKFLLKKQGMKGFISMFFIVIILISILFYFADEFMIGVIFGAYFVVFMIHGHSYSILKNQLDAKNYFEEIGVKVI